MNAELSLKASVLILLLFGGLLATIFWFYSLAAAVPALSHMHKSPDGRLYILLGTELLEHDSLGEPVRGIDLGEIGVEDMVGDFAFFSNGDLLIRIGADERDTSEKLRQFLRLENDKPIHGQDPAGGLFRCDLERMHCRPFGKPYLNLNQSFHLTVDWETDRVLIAEPSRHRLMLYSPDGRLLAESKEGLRYPNQVIYGDGLALVANTNRHRVSLFAVGEDSLRETGGGFQTAAVGLDRRGKIWPSAVMRVGDEIWVVNSGDGMADGVAVRFDAAGERIAQLDTPASADLFSILPFGDAVLVNDLRAGRIYRFSSTGQRLPDFESTLLAEKVQEHQGERDRLRFWMYLFIALFGLAFLAGLVVGFRQSLNS